MSSPPVSAIIPAHNEQDFIARAIESVSRQTYPNIETIVVNDGSTDNTGQIVQQNYPDVVYIEQENTGLPGARNAGARAARGQFLAFLDADDLWAPTKTELQLEVLAAHPEADLVGTNGVIHMGPHAFFIQSPRGPRLRELTMLELLGYPPYRRPPGASILVSKEAFDRIGGYDASLGASDDVDLFCRLVGHGHHFLYLNEPLYLMFRRPQAMSARPLSVRAADHLRLVNKWDPRDLHVDPVPLSPSEYSRVVADLAMLACACCYREGNREKAGEYLGWLDELPALPTVYRFQRWLARRCYPLLGAVAVTHQAYLRLLRVYLGWGIMGALDQVSRKLFRRGAIVPIAQET